MWLCSNSGAISYGPYLHNNFIIFVIYKGLSPALILDISNWESPTPKSLQMVIAAMKLKDAYSLRGKLWLWLCMDMRVGLWRKLSTETLMLLNCGIGEDSWEAFGLQGDPTSSSWRKSVLGVYWKDWCWSWNSSTLATSCKELTYWKSHWCWEGLGAGGEGDDRGWDGWMASPTRWAWVWVNSWSWWWKGRPGMLRFMGSQRVRHDWATEQQRGDSLVAHMVKNLPAVQEIQVWVLCQEDPLEKRMATRCHIIAWRIPWSEDSIDREFHGQRSKFIASQRIGGLSKQLTLSLSIREKISVLSLRQTSRGQQRPS